MDILAPLLLGMSFFAAGTGFIIWSFYDDDSDRYATKAEAKQIKAASFTVKLKATRFNNVTYWRFGGGFGGGCIVFLQNEVIDWIEERGIPCIVSDSRHIRFLSQEHADAFAEAWR